MYEMLEQVVNMLVAFPLPKPTVLHHADTLYSITLVW